LYDG